MPLGHTPFVASPIWEAYLGSRLGAVGIGAFWGLPGCLVRDVGLVAASTMPGMCVAFHWSYLLMLVGGVDTSRR